MNLQQTEAKKGAMLHKLKTRVGTNSAALVTSAHTGSVLERAQNHTWGLVLMVSAAFADTPAGTAQHGNLVAIDRHARDLLTWLQLRRQELSKRHVETEASAAILPAESPPVEPPADETPPDVVIH